MTLSLCLRLYGPFQSSKCFTQTDTPRAHHPPISFYSFNGLPLLYFYSLSMLPTFSDIFYTVFSFFLITQEIIYSHLFKVSGFDSIFYVKRASSSSTTYDPVSPCHIISDFISTLGLAATIPNIYCPSQDPRAIIIMRSLINTSKTFT